MMTENRHDVDTSGFNLSIHQCKVKFWKSVCLYSASSVIRTSNIRHLNDPNAKFHKPHPHYESHMGLGDCEILQNGIFQLSEATRSAENVLIIKEKLDSCKFLATDRSYKEHYGSRGSTTVTKS